MFAILAPLIGKALTSVFGLLDEVVEDKDKANELKAKLQQGVMDAVMQVFASQKELILAEMGGSSAQRNWRPHLMYMLMGLILFYGVVVPVLHAGLGWTFDIKGTWESVPTDLWTLLQIGMGGYIGGRSLEKIASTIAPSLGGGK